MKRKYIQPVLVIILLLLLYTCACDSKNEIQTISWFVADVDGDTLDELLCITAHTADMLTEDEQTG